MENLNYDLFYYLPFASSDYILPFTSLYYLLFVYIIGPGIMENKAPIKSVKKIMPLYNIIQILSNIILLYMAFSDWNFITTSVNNVCGFNEQSFIYKRKYIVLGYLWCLLKISDFLDTVFFILLKKNSHVSFLHVYHHSTTMIVAFILFRYLQLEQALGYAGLNCLVHVVMYFYYFLTSIGYTPKWKKVVTMFQLFQFLSLFLMTLKLITCQTQIKYISFSIFSIFQCLMYIYLFGKFYLNSYLKKKIN